MKQESQTLSGEFPGKAMVTARGELIEEREGKALYHSEKPDLIIQEFRENGKAATKKTAHNLGTLRNQISSYLFEYVEGYHIPTHYVSQMSPSAMVVKRLKMFPLTVRMYNTAGGALSKRYGLKEGTRLEYPVIE